MFSLKTIAQVMFKVLAVALGIFTLRWFNNTDYVPRALADEYSKILAINSILSGLLAFGIPNIIQKVFTKQDDPQIRSNTLYTMNILRFLTLIIGILLVSVLYFLNNQNQIVFSYLKLSNYTLFLGLFVTQFFLFGDLNFRSVADSTGRSWIYSLTDFGSRLVYVAALYILVIFIKPNPETIVWIIVVAGLIANFGTLLADYLIYTKNLPKPKFDKDIIKLNLNTIIYIGMVGTFIGLSNRFDTILLAGDEGVVRGYSAAYQIFDTIQIIPAITMPVLATYLKRRGGYSFNYIGLSLVAGVGLALVSLIGAPILLSITKASQNYPSSSNVMWIFIIGLVPAFMNNLVHYLNIFDDREKQETFTIVGSGIITIILYIIFIPKYGIFAAAWVTVFGGYLTILLKGILLLSNYLKDKRAKA